MRHWFLPHKEEKKRSKLLQHPALFGYVFFLFAMLFSSYLVVSGASNVLGYATDINVQELLKYTNQRRADIGVKPLKLNDKLSKAAYAKAQNMFAENYWAHTSPSGKEPWDFIIASGYDYLYAGENLAVDFAHSKSVVDAWYNSPSHRANLLNGRYTDVGFAVVNGTLQGRKTTLIVQMFGYPRKRIAKVVPEDEVLNKNKVTSLANSETSQANKNDEENNENNSKLKNEPTKNTENINEQDNNGDKGEGETNSNSNEKQIDLDNEVESNSENKNDNQDAIANLPPDDRNGKILNTSNVYDASKYLAVTLGLFLSLLFAVDGYYVRKHDIFRISGHTILHIMFLLLAIVAIWYASIGLIL